jgi:hypothetical protein
MTPSRHIVGMAILLSALSAPALGQDVSSIEPGDTVRLIAKRVSGVHIVLQNSGSALDLRDRREVVQTVPLADVRRLERLDGRTSWGGAIQGGALGLLAGAVLGAGIGHLADDPGAFLPGWFAGGALSAIAGTVTGAIKGAKRGAPRWRAVKLTARYRAMSVSAATSPEAEAPCFTASTSFSTGSPSSE